MKETRSVGSRGGAQFAPTRWTLVLSARTPDTPAATRALAELCQLYWYPLYAYVRRRGYAPHDAQDLTQVFFARLLEKHKLAGLTREKGKFRSFLLTALNHFLLDEWKRGQAQKRGAQQTVSLDTATAETRYRLEPADTLTPEKVFEKQWALTLLETVFNRLQQEYVTADKGGVFAELEFALTGTRSSVPKLRPIRGGWHRTWPRLRNTSRNSKSSNCFPWAGWARCTRPGRNNSTGSLP